MLSAPATAAEALMKVRRLVGTDGSPERTTGAGGIGGFPWFNNDLSLTDWTARPMDGRVRKLCPPALATRPPVDTLGTKHHFAAIGVRPHSELF